MRKDYWCTTSITNYKNRQEIEEEKNCFFFIQTLQMNTYKYEKPTVEATFYRKTKKWAR